MIDTHCHLTHPRLAADRDAVIERAREQGLLACVSIGTGIDDAREVARLAADHPGFVHGTAGLDPFTCHAVGERFEAELERLAQLLDSGTFVAVGEIGLDFHYDLDPPPLQAERLEKQLDLARERDLPVVIHVREAHEELLSLFARRGPGDHGVIHSFTAGPVEAVRYLELGWCLAFNGVITFPGAGDVREAARLVPAERLLIETDSPYLAPVPHRGRRCEPALIRHTLSRLAEVRNEDPEALRLVTTENARRLFRIGDA
jgi:TatD DNase family protein